MSGNMSGNAKQGPRNLWEIYDELIEGIDPALKVDTCLIGANWSMVGAAGARGVALAIKDYNLPFTHQGTFIGAALRDVAACAKSWNFAEASLGMAAINCYYNNPERLERLGLIAAGDAAGENRKQEAFTAFADDIAGKNVCVIGHFPHIEKQLGPICNLTVLERAQSRGDYPDSACEFVLPEQDLVFITGMTFTNKTIVRLLDIIRPETKVSIVGPSVPASDVLFNHNVDNLSCFSVKKPTVLDEQLRCGSRNIFVSGTMLSYNKPE